MMISTSFWLTFSHALPRRKGAHGRAHEHEVQVTFTLNTQPNPLTGISVPFDDFRTTCAAVLAKVPHEPDKPYDIRKIPGIHPTWESFTLWLREQLLSTYSSAATAALSVSLRDDLYEVTS